MIVKIPDGVRCAIALSYDLEMSGGYEPNGGGHGRVIPEVQDYARGLCDVAEEYGAKLHFFCIGNGVEHTLPLLNEIISRGHIIDSHTYSHFKLRSNDISSLKEELEKTNRLFEEKLGWKSTILRGPGGYQDGLDGLIDNQQVILDNGFKVVSCRHDWTVLEGDRKHVLNTPRRDPPYMYPTGLVEIPFQGFSDRTFFDDAKNVCPEKYKKWRSIPWNNRNLKGWMPPWTAKDALDEWIKYHRQAVDYAYEHKLLWVPCWHPLSHYLHDRENTVLRKFLEYCTSKPEKVWVCTVRDAAEMLDK